MKKFFALTLAVLMVAAMFAGCSAPQTNNNNNGSNVIKVGTMGPLTGDYAVYGKAVENGLKLAFEEINALGGLQFEVRAEEDAADASTAVNAYNTLMDWGMQIMAGPTTSGAAAAVAAECAKDKVFMLTPSASDASVIAAGSNVFQICFTDPNQGKASAQFIKNNNVATKVGVIYDSSNPYSDGIFATFKAEAQAIGLEIAVEAPFTNDTKGDLSNQVAQCQQAGCDLVFLPIYTAEAVRVLSVANSSNYKTKFFGCDGLDGILSVQNFDTSLAEGVMLLTPFDATSTDAKTQAFVQAYTQKFGTAPNQFAADAYDVGYAIYEACKACNITASMSAEQINTLLVQKFTSMSFDGITGKAMTWSADGAVNKAPMAVKIENGAYVGMQ